MRFSAKKIVFLMIIVVASIIGQSSAQELSVEEYIARASELNSRGKVEDAVSLLENSLKMYPHDSDIHAYLGLYTGALAGSTKDPMKAMNYVNRAFSLLDKAVALDTTNATAYLFRGILSVRVPEFFGKLAGAISDLQRAVALLETSPGKGKSGKLLTAYTTLAEAYGKSNDVGKQRHFLEKAVAAAEDSSITLELRKKLEGLPAGIPEDSSLLESKETDTREIAELKNRIKENPENTELLLQLGRAYFDRGAFEESKKVLETFVSLDPTSFEAYRMLAVATAGMAMRGYDERIAENTDYRSSLTFEAMNYATKAVALQPENYRIRLLRGIFGVSFPFFVGKMEQGIEDLRFVLKSEAPDSVKAEAMYYLGVANQKKAMKFWRETIEKAPGSDIARAALEGMRPDINHFDPSNHDRPVVAVDLVIGYKDELPPQTAVWIEDEKGNYVKTLYVSGFSGHAKQKQVNLPVWAAVSEFKGIDAVTGASIDVGHHVFTWNCRDLKGKRVRRGTYRVIAECSFWPSMKYQRVEGKIEIGRKFRKTLLEEGQLLPYMEITYYPE